MVGSILLLRKPKICYKVRTYVCMYVRNYVCMNERMCVYVCTHSCNNWIILIIIVVINFINRSIPIRYKLARLCLVYHQYHKSQNTFSNLGAEICGQRYMNFPSCIRCRKILTILIQNTIYLRTKGK